MKVKFSWACFSLLDVFAFAYGPSAETWITWAFSLVLWFAGASVASFSCLVYSRLRDLPEDASILGVIAVPSSYCDHCKRKISPLDIVPVLGWLLSRGRCRKCGGSIPPFYPVMEFALGTLTALIPFLVGGGNELAVSLIFILWISIVISVIDVRLHIIPEELTYVLLFTGLIFSPLVVSIDQSVLGAAMGCFIMWFALYLVGALKGIDASAGGDVAFAAAAGAWVGIGLVPAYIMVSSLLFVVHCLMKHRSGEVWVPMAPSLSIGLLAVFLYKTTFPF